MASLQDPKPKPSAAKKTIWQTKNGSSPQAKSFVTPPGRTKHGSPDASLATPPAPKKKFRKTSATLGDEDPVLPMPLPLHLRVKKTSEQSNVIVDPSFDCKQESAGAKTVAAADKPKEEVLFDNDSSSSSPRSDRQTQQ